MGGFDVGAEFLLGTCGGRAGDVDVRDVCFKRFGTVHRRLFFANGFDSKEAEDGIVLFIADLQQHIVDGQGDVFIGRGLVQADVVWCDAGDGGGHPTADLPFVDKGGEFRPYPILDPFVQFFASIGDVHIGVDPPASKG